MHLKKLTLALALLLPNLSQAQTVFSESFDGRNRRTIGNGWFETEHNYNDVRVKNGAAVLRDNARGAPDAALSGFLRVILVNRICRLTGSR